MSAFVSLWVWLAVSVRRFDTALAVTIPAWLHPVGLAVASAGALLAAVCVVLFVTEGRGTPAPFDPPRDFVASGPYRFVRNPMYLGASSIVLGTGLTLSSPSIVLLGMGFLAIAHLFVVLYEEPALTRTFGARYLHYKASVHRWLPGRPGSRARRAGDP